MYDSMGNTLDVVCEYSKPRERQGILSRQVKDGLEAFNRQSIPRVEITDMWFCVSLLRVAEINGQRDEKSLWEERFMLIKSANEQDARSQIEEICGQNQAAYKNNKGDLISWKFVTVERVYPSIRTI
jgi:hypothetical protein